MLVKRSWRGLALLAVTGLVGCAGLAGCAGNTGAGPAPVPGGSPSEAGGSPSATAWAEPPRYGFVVESTCGERALIGRFRVFVADGRVTRTEGLDDAARRAVHLRLANLVPTLGQLVAEAQAAREDGAEVVRTDVDPVDGHPTTITIDRSTDAVDDEACYAISDYTIGAAPTAAGSPSK